MLVQAAPRGLRGESDNVTDVASDEALFAALEAIAGNASSSTASSLSAMVATASGRCSSWAGAAEGLAPGCLGQCYWAGICSAINSVAGVYRKNKKDMNRIKAEVCAHKDAFKCLLWQKNRRKCDSLVRKGPSFGLPTMSHDLDERCQRRLDEVPVHGSSVSATELDALAADENVTLDAMVTATLSANAAGCYASTTLLRHCGAGCFGRPGGSVRVECITTCLEAKIQGSSCASCYGRRSDCTLDHCFGPCSRSASGSACTDCVHSRCGGDCR